MKFDFCPCPFLKFQLVLHKLPPTSQPSTKETNLTLIFAMTRRSPGPRDPALVRLPVLLAPPFSPGDGAGSGGLQVGAWG